MTVDTSTAPIDANPLWVIAIFVVLSEAVAGFAAVVTDGTSRLVFTIFGVVFPFVVFGVFVWLLVNRPVNLYAPRQLPGGTSFADYVAATSRDGIRAAAQAAAEAASVITGIDDDELVGKAALRYESAIEAASVTIEFEGFGPLSGPAFIPISDDTTAQNLLDSVYFLLPLDAVDAYTYGQQWILKNESGETLPDLNTGHRRLSEAGVERGQRLTAVRIQRPLSTSNEESRDSPCPCGSGLRFHHCHGV